MISKTLAFAPGVLAGLVLALAIATPGARAYHTNFQGSCNNSYFATSGVTRAQARIYAEIGASEGYQWGGGRLCYPTIAGSSSRWWRLATGHRRQGPREPSRRARLPFGTGGRGVQGLHEPVGGGRSSARVAPR